MPTPSPGPLSRRNTHHPVPESFESVSTLLPPLPPPDHRCRGFASLPHRAFTLLMQHVLPYSRTSSPHCSHIVSQESCALQASPVVQPGPGTWGGLPKHCAIPEAFFPGLSGRYPCHKYIERLASNPAQFPQCRPGFFRIERAIPASTSI